MAHSFRKMIAGIGSALLIILISVLLLEATLQVASRLVEKRVHPLTGKEVPSDGRTRIVTLGDSNTYGLYLEEPQSWPRQFEHLWNERHGDRPIQVINLAYPGTDSSRVLKSLPEVIRVFSPDVIAVMVGVNDHWTAPVNLENFSAPISLVEGWMRDHLRTYRLIYMLRRSFYQPELLTVDETPRHQKFDEKLLKQHQDYMQGKGPPVTADKPQAVKYGDTVFDIGYVMDMHRQQNPGEDIKRNLTQMVHLARGHGVQLVLVTYAYYEFPQKTANWQMKAVAKSEQVPLVNVAKAFRAQCSVPARCEALFFPDYHPTAEGYAIIAAEMEKYFSHPEKLVTDEP